MTTVDQPCPLCGATETEHLKSFEDGVGVGRCLSCGLMYTPQRHEQPESLLASMSLEKMRLLHEPILSGRLPHFRKTNFEEYLDIVARHASGKRLLDVGCAHGLFTAMARDAGYEVMAVEPSPTMAAFAREQHKLSVLHGRLDQVDLEDRRFDVVTFTDSLEYFPDPVGAVQKAAEHLDPGGVLFLKVPNGAYFRTMHTVATRLGRSSGAFTPSLRVVHYRSQDLECLIEKAGLQVVESGAPEPVDSPTWRKRTGLPLAVAEPRTLAEPARSARRLLWKAGQIQRKFSERNDLSPSIYVVGRKAS